jgi:succinate dehydrogenase/fumarate reductase-like Fe-S protein
MEKIGKIISDAGSEILKNLITMQEQLIPDLIFEIECLNKICPTFAFSEILSKNIFNSSTSAVESELRQSNDINKNIKLN